MKTRTLLIAAVMFLGLTAASFAQATFSVGSIPVTAVINTGQVEQTGDITFTQVNNGNTTQTGTITVTYPGTPITVAMSATNGNPGFGVRIVNVSGATLSGVNPPADNTTVAILSVSSGASTGTGQVVIQVPANATALSFTLTGVRVAVAGTTLTNQVALISTTNNAITAGQTSVVVISSIAPGIASIKTTTTGAINGVSGSVTAQPVVTVKEGFLNAFGDPTVSTEAGIRITLSGNPPAGVTVTFPATASTANAAWRTMNSDGTDLGTTVPITSTSTNLTVFYREVSPNDPTAQETLTIPVTLSVSSSASLPLPTTTITYTVSLAPIGTAFDSDGKVITTANLIPRYAALEVGPATLFGIAGLNTVLIVPFAQTVTALGFNTGLAISNTTEDPGKTAMGGIAAATPQSGTITFFFFPALPSPSATNPTNFSFTPTGTFGHGLDSNGKLIPGGTFVALISEILAAASQPTEFSGYIFVVTNFTNAHGFWTVSDFKSFSQGGMMLVVTGLDRSLNTPEALNN